MTAMISRAGRVAGVLAGIGALVGAATPAAAAVEEGAGALSGTISAPPLASGCGWQSADLAWTGTVHLEWDGVTYTGTLQVAGTATTAFTPCSSGSFDAGSISATVTSGGAGFSCGSLDAHGDPQPVSGSYVRWVDLLDAGLTGDCRVGGADLGTVDLVITGLVGESVQAGVPPSPSAFAATVYVQPHPGA